MEDAPIKQFHKCVVERTFFPLLHVPNKNMMERCELKLGTIQTQIFPFCPNLFPVDSTEFVCSGVLKHCDFPQIVEHTFANDHQML